MGAPFSVAVVVAAFGSAVTSTVTAAAYLSISVTPVIEMAASDRTRKSSAQKKGAGQ
jgi:hypothetical protein